MSGGSSLYFLYGARPCIPPKNLYGALPHTPPKNLFEKRFFGISKNFKREGTKYALQVLGRGLL
jgi:hypothetical protein